MLRSVGSIELVRDTQELDASHRGALEAASGFSTSFSMTSPMSAALGIEFVRDTQELDASHRVALESASGFSTRRRMSAALGIEFVRAPDRPRPPRAAAAAPRCYRARPRRGAARTRCRPRAQGRDPRRGSGIPRSAPRSEQEVN